MSHLAAGEPTMFNLPVLPVRSRLGIFVLAVFCAISAAHAQTPVVAAETATPSAGAADAGQPAPMSAMPASITPAPASFDLRAGGSSETQLKAWAKRAGWTVVWNTPDDWIVPADHTFTTDFPEAAQAVLTALAENGADIRVDVYPDDHSVVVRQAGTE